MKRIKIIFWVVVFVFIGIVIFQNHDFFQKKQSFHINLLVSDYKTPDLPHAVIFLFSFLAGLFLAYFFSVLEGVKYRRVIKNLNKSVENHLEEMGRLKEEMKILKAHVPEEQKLPGEEPPGQQHHDQPFEPGFQRI
ncbi:MAG: LapA family protein [Desulfobacterales bacterium]|nr:LapA family protein [Desulfobacterales bacterium]